MKRGFVRKASLDIGGDWLIGCGALIGLFVIMCVCFVGCYGCSNKQYSEGFRDGVVQKVSYKGMIWKTFEGEMLLGGMSYQDGDGGGTINRQMFKFSCNNPDVIKDLQALKPGQMIRLHYDQKLTTWVPNGETDYFITKVEVIKAEKK